MADKELTDLLQIFLSFPKDCIATVRVRVRVQVRNDKTQKFVFDFYDFSSGTPPTRDLKSSDTRAVPGTRKPGPKMSLPDPIRAGKLTLGKTRPDLKPQAKPGVTPLMKNPTRPDT